MKLRCRNATATFEEGLAEQAQKFRQMANQLPDGSKARDVLLRRARQMESESRGFTETLARTLGGQPLLTVRRYGLVNRGETTTASSSRPEPAPPGTATSRPARPLSAATQVLHRPQSHAMRLFDQRGIGRFLGSGIRSVIGSSSVTADARVLGALLKISSAAFWKAAVVSSFGGRLICVDARVAGLDDSSTAGGNRTSNNRASVSNRADRVTITK